MGNDSYQSIAARTGRPPDTQQWNILTDVSIDAESDDRSARMTVILHRIHSLARSAVEVRAMVANYDHAHSRAKDETRIAAAELEDKAAGEEQTVGMNKTNHTAAAIRKNENIDERAEMDGSVVDMAASENRMKVVGAEVVGTVFAGVDVHKNAAVAVVVGDGHV